MISKVSEILGHLRASNASYAEKDRTLPWVCWGVYRPLSLYLTVPFVLMGIGPNGVTALRFVCISLALTLFGRQGRVPHTAAAWISVLEILLDYVDGNIARSSGRCTRLGAILDEMADRMTAILYPSFVALGVFLDRDHSLDSRFAAVAGPWVVWVGVWGSVSTFACYRWKAARLRELLALARGRRPAAAPTRPPDGRGWPPAARPVFRALAGASHVNQALIALYAPLGVETVFLLFKAVYQPLRFVEKRLAPPARVG